VRFSLSSVFLPESVLQSLTPESEVEGRIVGFSDSGPSAKAFAVVEVVRRVTVVVPASSLELVEAQ
jgi:hypothetical protein